MAEENLECVFPGQDGAADQAACGLDRCRDRELPAPRPLFELIPCPASRYGPGVQTWAVGVTTAPRRQPTLDICLESLRRAGWERPWLFVDGGTRLARHQSQLPVTYREERIGAWPNFYLALQELLLRQPEADAFLLVQDDALFYDGENVRRYLESSLWPAEDVAAVSLYCPEPYTCERAGWHRLEETWIWGSLAIVFSNSAARQFAIDPEVFAHRWEGRRPDAHVDVVIGAWARRKGGHVHYPVPSLVQHVGQASTLWPAGRADGRRRASWFVGQTPDRPPEWSERAGEPAPRPAVHNSVELSQLAVVCCSFHPNARWLENYARFREGLGAHGMALYTVEGVLRGEASIVPTDDRTRRFELEDSLWHKERLLNLGIAALPADIDAVGWFDADVLFRHDNLQQAILAALGRCPVIQPWRVCEWLDAAGQFVPWGSGNRWAQSLAAKNCTRSPRHKVASPRFGHPGLAWAARRESLDAMGGLFDRHPVGGGDTVMAIAFWGDWGASYLEQYNEPMRQTFQAWGQRAYAVVQGNVGFVDAAISHLWHGSRRARKYAERNRILSQLGMDPATHLESAPNGTWRWSADAPPAIIQYVRDYFAGRRHDAKEQD